MAQPLQPNYVLMNQGLQQFTTEIAKLANIPQVGLQDIQRSINQLGVSLRSELKGVEDRLQTKFSGISEQLLGVEQQIQAVEEKVQGLKARLHGVEVGVAGLQKQMMFSTRNAIARSQNSTMHAPASPLVPLVNVMTGDPIGGFPGTISELNALTGPTIRATLAALGMDSAGTLAECRSRLLQSVGVTTLQAYPPMLIDHPRPIPPSCASTSAHARATPARHISPPFRHRTTQAQPRALVPRLHAKDERPFLALSATRVLGLPTVHYLSTSTSVPACRPLP
ncbi:hypothetical protein HYPSUDRAFT_209467 [Hypholoma sublateritium FD-334 SS-4]|uniref:Uncharacterized protein n=1 Tax=Hypholoma sublateritium (strain FD-334 SS-4) TaxID=945553 RepID=A0A0D2N2M8_HYPSF|nr:hypothetical protein HYPSUDRAFT_209467 [Hypholoma sublateritium FD-334 SS-4]